MKLCLGMLEQDLFSLQVLDISQSTISSLLEKWIHDMAHRLSFLVKWPERDQFRKTMPSYFRDHSPKCVVIINCFEVFIEKPNDLTARAQTFSTYKHLNTVKVMVGITPQGTISFISQPWGGRVSSFPNRKLWNLKKFTPKCCCSCRP